MIPCGKPTFPFIPVLPSWQTERKLFPWLASLTQFELLKSNEKNDREIEQAIQTS